MHYMHYKDYIHHDFYVYSPVLLTQYLGHCWHTPCTELYILRISAWLLRKPPSPATAGGGTIWLGEGGVWGSLLIYTVYIYILCIYIYIIIYIYCIHIFFYGSLFVGHSNQTNRAARVSNWLTGPRPVHDNHSNGLSFIVLPRNGEITGNFITCAKKNMPCVHREIYLF